MALNNDEDIITTIERIGHDLIKKLDNKDFVVTLKGGSGALARYYYGVAKILLQAQEVRVKVGTTDQRKTARKLADKLKQVK